MSSFILFSLNLVTIWGENTNSWFTVPREIRKYAWALDTGLGSQKCSGAFAGNVHCEIIFLAAEARLQIFVVIFLPFGGMDQAMTLIWALTSATSSTAYDKVDLGAFF